MQELFVQLQKLQDVLSGKYKIENELKELPQRLTTKDEVLLRLKNSNEERQQAEVEKQKELHRLRLEMGDIEKRREMLEGRMNSIKTQREYEALDKEIMDAGQSEQKLRRYVQHCENELEELRSALVRDKAMIESQQQELVIERSKLNNEQESYLQELKTLKEEEASLIPGLAPELLFKFDRILRNKEGLGIVPLLRSICSGCHMMLPAQFVGDVRQGEDVHFCPYCSRILYYEEGGDNERMVELEEEADEVGALADIMGDQDSANFYKFDDFDDFDEEG